MHSIDTNSASHKMHYKRILFDVKRVKNLHEKYYDTELVKL